MLLHLVVPLPVPHDVRPDEVADAAVLPLEGGGKVGGQEEAEGEDVLTPGQAGTLLRYCQAGLSLVQLLQY